MRGWRTDLRYIARGLFRRPGFSVVAIGTLGLGIGLAALRQLLERRIRYRETVENDLGLRVLCVVPEVSGLTDERDVA